MPQRVHSWLVLTQPSYVDKGIYLYYLCTLTSNKSLEIINIHLFIVHSSEYLLSKSLRIQKRCKKHPDTEQQSANRTSVHNGDF